MRGRQLSRLVELFRRTGADVPGGDPLPTHRAEMEGWFWRFTDVERGRVVLALCGVNQHRDGPWATVAVAAHPGEIVRSAAVDGAFADASSFVVSVRDVLRADRRSLRVDLEDVSLAVTLDAVDEWPRRLGGGGLFSTVPFLGQYWHPWALGGRVSGSLRVGAESWSLDGATLYAEKNWGAGFPDRWWWGQAQGFPSDPSACVAFGGGRLTTVGGRVGFDVTGAVVRVGGRVVRFAPPFARVTAVVGDDSWRVDARTPRWRLALDGDGAGHRPAVLPVPLPDERRNVDRDFEHLAGRLRLRLWRAGEVVIDDESRLAALEVGSTS